MARIVVESGPLRGKVFPIEPRSKLDLGRDSACLIHVADQRVSRQHCIFSGSDSGFLLLDEGSSNGTFVNGRRVSKAALHTGDLIRIGETFISFFDEAEDPLVGKVVAGYRIEHRVGRGGMGTVYRAVQVTLARTVAFKVLSRDLTEDQEFIGRFIEEARAAAKLNHPNVVQVYNAGRHDGIYFLSMEFMPGGSLQELLDKKGRLPLKLAIAMILDAARALIWAEQNSIVHRDIKPDNLLLGPGNVVKIGDFGLAADKRKSKTLFEGGKVLGTPRYMAPEQALGKKLDHRADIYALGSTLYTALAGMPPFDGDTAMEILLKKIKEEPQPLIKVAPDIPEPVALVVERMMAQDPAARFQTALEAHAVLTALLKTGKLPESFGERHQQPSRLSRFLGRAFQGKLSKLSGKAKRRSDPGST